MWVYGLNWAGPGQRQVADACECGNEPSGSVYCGEFLDQLQTSQILKKDSAPWSKQVEKPTIIEAIRLNRLRWFGHVQRMEENRIPKRVLCTNLGAIRMRGKPRNRWQDAVREDGRYSWWRRVARKGT